MTQLSDFDQGFNAGIKAAVDYHEKRASAASDAARFARGASDELAGACISVMCRHREHSNNLRALRRLTPEEAAREDEIAREMN